MTVSLIVSNFVTVCQILTILR